MPARRNFKIGGSGSCSRQYSWTGDFNGDGRSELLVYIPYSRAWRFGLFNGPQATWYTTTYATELGNLADGRLLWAGDFNGDGRTEILFYFPGDDNWWLGSLVSNTQWQWALVGNTAGFGHNIYDGRPFWTGNFSSPTRAEVLFYFPGDNRWWLGSWNGSQLTWTLAGQTGFGNMADGRPIWIGDFNGDGRSEVLFYYPGDDNWWLGTFNGTQLAWTLAGNTAGFGHAIYDGRPFWIGRFSSAARTQVLFYFPGDGNFWLGTYDGQALGWRPVGTSGGFGNLADGRPFWAGDFTGDGRADLLFYYPGDHSWWLGSLAGAQLAWSQVGNTSGFGTVWEDGWPFWVGRFAVATQAEMLFYYGGDYHWWLAIYANGTFTWSLAAVTAPPPPQPPQPPTMTTVPNVVGLLLSQAGTALDGAHLVEGLVWNSTGEYHTALLRVTNQDPTPGTSVAQGSAVNLRVELATPRTGIKQISFYNCSTDRRTVHIWVYDGATGAWSDKGSLAPQYGAGICPAPGSSPLDVTFESGHGYVVAAVDPGMISCTGNDPTVAACQRWAVNLAGDDNGQTVQQTIS